MNQDPFANPYDTPSPAYNQPSYYATATAPTNANSATYPNQGFGSSIFDSDELFSNSNPMASMGLKYVRDIGQQGVSRYMPGASLLWESLHHYFNVNNSYVRNKLKVLLVPFTHKAWRRVMKEAPPVYNPDGSYSGNVAPPAFAPPVLDINAPDLYLPTMSFITFVLLVGFLAGTSMQFTPEILVTVMSSCTMYVILEILLIKLGLYLLEVENIPLLDICALSGYKFVDICLNLIFGVLFGKTFYYVALVYTSVAGAYFSLQSWKQIVPLAGSNIESKKRKTWFVVGIALVQILQSMWLGYSGDI